MAKVGDIAMVVVDEPCFAQIYIGDMVKIKEIDEPRTYIVEDVEGSVWHINPYEVKIIENKGRE